MDLRCLILYFGSVRLECRFDLRFFNVSCFVSVGSDVSADVSFLLDAGAALRFGFVSEDCLCFGESALVCLRNLQMEQKCFVVLRYVHRGQDHFVNLRLLVVVDFIHSVENRLANLHCILRYIFLVW